MFDSLVEKAGPLQFALMRPRTSCILQSRHVPKGRWLEFVGRNGALPNATAQGAQVRRHRYDEDVLALRMQFAQPVGDARLLRVDAVAARSARTLVGLRRSGKGRRLSGRGPDRDERGPGTASRHSTLAKFLVGAAR